MADTLDQGIAHHNAGRVREAEQIYRHLLSIDPNHADALHLLGLIAYQVGRNEEALELIRRALALQPQVAGIWSNFGLALMALGRLPEALAAGERAVALGPNYSPGHINLALALRRVGRMDEALFHGKRAVELAPAEIGTRDRYANILLGARQFEEAIAFSLQTLKLDSRDADAEAVIAAACSEIGDQDGSIAAYQRAIALRPGVAEAYSSMARSLKDAGRIDDSVRAYREAMRLSPDLITAHSGLLYALHFHPAYNAEAIYREHLAFDERHARPLAKGILPHANDRAPDRRLRIGYFCADYRAHSSSLFTLPLFQAHDRSQVEVYCFGDVLAPDFLTERIRGAADVYRNVTGLLDEQLAEQVRADRIDVLVDLTMHMGRGRPLLFARKPAPVQVAWLAYPGTTGLSAMDYRLTDPYLDPVRQESPQAPGSNDAFYSEKSVRLPDSFWCFAPLTDGPTVNALPAATGAPITFGCFSNFCKVGDITIELWAGVLTAVPGSRLVIQVGEGSMRAGLRQRLEARGIAGDRVGFVNRLTLAQYLALYRTIDITLDPFPYNGHTTSLESLWMGVPLVSLCGKTAVSRAGLCQLSNVGLADLVAHSPQEYASIAAALAADLPRLSQLRATLRQRMEESPLMDMPRFARNIEAAYRMMWQRWVQEGSFGPPCGPFSWRMRGIL